MKKYVVIGGWVRSKYDKDEHYVNALDLCHLYHVNPNECLMLETHNYKHYLRELEWRDLEGLIRLEPKYDGNYNLQSLGDE